MEIRVSEKEVGEKEKEEKFIYWGMSHNIVSFIYVYLCMFHIYYIYINKNIFTGIFDEMRMTKTINNCLSSVTEKS